MPVTNRHASEAGLRQAGTIVLAIGLVMAGCAGSGDVEKVRQERTQAKAKMSAELQQESDLTASMKKALQRKAAAALSTEFDQM